VKLVDISAISIRRHVKIRAAANPYDPKWEMYFEERAQPEMKRALSGRLWKLWSRQDGRCPVCTH
jgi:RNA-directed DNA polymerase